MVDFHARTDVGRKRKQNEDAHAVILQHQLFVVADGVGGRKAGELASALTVDTFQVVAPKIHEAVEAFLLSPNRNTRTEVLTLLADAASAASSRVFELADQTGREGMTSTLVAAVVGGSTAFLVHVGDSRIYLQRQGQLRQLTEDHSLVSEMVRAGSMTPEEAAVSRYRNVITRAIGLYPHVHSDTLAVDLLPGDRLLLCTDGLSDLVPPDAMSQILSQPDLQGAVESLVDMALEAGGKDNITAIGIAPDVTTPSGIIAARAAVLEKLFLFADLPDQARIRVYRIVSDRTVKSGETLVHQDTSGDTMYIIVHGEFEVLIDGERIATIGKGEHFGELCLVDDAPRSATIRALHDADVLSIDRDTLRAYCAMEAEMGNRILWRLLATLSQRLRYTNHQLISSRRGDEPSA